MTDHLTRELAAPLDRALVAGRAVAAGRRALAAGDRRCRGADVLPIGAARARHRADAAAATEPAQIDARHGVPTFLWGTRRGRARWRSGTASGAKAALDDEAHARAHLRDLADVYAITPGRGRRAAGAQPAAPPERRRDRALRAARSTASRSSANRSTCCSTSDGALVADRRLRDGRAGRARKRAQAFARRRPRRARAPRSPTTGFAPDVAARCRATATPRAATRRIALPAGAASADGATLAAPRARKRVWFRAGRRARARVVRRSAGDATACAPHGVDYYAYVVSAVDASLLFRNNQIAHAAFSYRVYAEPTPPYLPLPGPGGRGGFPHPTGTPDGYQPPIVAPNLVTLESAPFSRNDPWLPPARRARSATTSRRTRTWSSPTASARPAPTSATSRSRSTATSTRARARPARSTTRTTHEGAGRQPRAGQAAHHAAVLHDQLPPRLVLRRRLRRGVRQRQTNNFGRGGLAERRIIAEAQDLLGTCNANMVTPADGQRPRHAHIPVVDGRHAVQGARAARDRRRQAVRPRGLRRAELRRQQQRRAGDRRRQRGRAHARPTAARRSPTPPRSPAGSR